MPDPRWQRARRILAVRLDQIGDVLMTGPALRALRDGPSVEHVALLTSRSGAAIAALMPGIDAVHVYDAPWMKAAHATGHDADAVMIEALRAGMYDGAVIFTVNTQTPIPAMMLCRLAGIPLVLAHVRERVYGLCSDAVPEPETGIAVRHEVQRQLDLVATLGWRVSDSALRLCLRGEACSGGRIVVHPGSTAPSRRYSPENFRAAMHMLADAHGHRFLLTGDASERDLCDALASDHATSLAGELTLAELVALIADAPLLIANNTGPAHIAAAVGTPVVVLYALTNPQHTPWMVPARVLSHDVPCRWCLRSICPEGHHRCLRGVPPEAVAAAAVELMRQPVAA